MNKKLIQSYLDRAAEELDEAGFRDLADKVDAFNSQLMAPDSETKRQSIAAELSKIDREAKRRVGEPEEPEAKEAEETEKEDTRSARLASLKRRMAIRRRLKAKMAERTEQRQENLARARRMARLARARREDAVEDDVAERRAAIRRRIASRLAK